MIVNSMKQRSFKVYRDKMANFRFMMDIFFQRLSFTSY